MIKNSSLFSQILRFFSRIEFENMVKNRMAEYKSKGFSCWQQFVSMLFCQLGKANSLNEITKGLANCEGILRQHIILHQVKVKNAAKHLLHRLREVQPSVLIQDCCKDIQSQLRVKTAVEEVLDADLPET
jgi:hypothetical protein